MRSTTIIPAQPLHPKRTWLRSMVMATLLTLLPVSWAAAQGPPVIVITPPALAAREGVVWGGLICASDTAPAEHQISPAEFPDLKLRLARVFPRYPYFEILGQHTQIVYRQYESWVVPSQNFFLKIDSRGAAPRGGLLVHLQFWGNQQVMVKLDAILRPNSPLFVAGPKWRKGRLIFAVVLRRLEPSYPRP